MADTPTTDEIVKALLTLGVKGPAVAVDVLGAAGLPLPTWQVPDVLDELAVRVVGQVEEVDR